MPSRVDQGNHADFFQTSLSNRTFLLNDKKNAEQKMVRQEFSGKITHVGFEKKYWRLNPWVQFKWIAFCNNTAHVFVRDGKVKSNFGGKTVDERAGKAPREKPISSKILNDKGSNGTCVVSMAKESCRMGLQRF